VIPPRLPIALAGLVSGALLWTPRIAVACSVCSAGREDETRTAFIVTTAFMSALPLVVVGGAVWWLRRRARSLEGAEARDREHDTGLAQVRRVSSSQ
jgi:hypothetical protein